MTDYSEKLTSTDIIAAATQTLIGGDYQRIAKKYKEWDTSSTRLFEDEYNIVGVVVFDTCEELLRTWSDMQGSLVEVISQNIGRGESKSWDGYLVLLSPSLARSMDPLLATIRQDTLRLRKFVATGDDLRDTRDVERVLRPILPLSMEQAKLSQASVFDILPRLLSEQDIPQEMTQILIDSFREQLPLLERLHQMLSER